MTTSDTPAPAGLASVAASPWTIAIAGMLALATAMGIGRFAFTPLLPMMLADGVIDLPSASWLASANYLGYLIGALFCTFQPLIWRKLGGLPPVAASTWIRVGLVATCLLTLGMSLHVPAVWPLLRFASGVASALVFVYTSGWCMAQLARHGAAALGGAMFVGPGAGILLSGLFASGMVALHWTAASGWLILGVLAMVLTALVWPTVHASRELPVPVMAATSGDVVGAVLPAASASEGQMLLLAFAYGLAGFGYIITATFLPVIAREALPGSAWLNLFWPIFGIGIMTGAMLATRVPTTGDMRHLLAGCYVMQALGIGASLWSPSLTGFILGSLLLGIPFTAITFFALQEVRRLRPLQAASYMGLLTAVYGIGQIAGPPMVAVLLRHSTTLGQGFTRSLEIAASTLEAGAVMYVWMARAYPMRPAASA